MKKTLHWFLILTVCASFNIINGLSHSRLATAEDYERADRMLAEVDVSGFISIDCGSTEDYRDEETGFWYQTDKNYVETGESYKASGSAYSNIPYFGKQFNTLRCFPKGDRNCYILRPEQGNSNSKYLIRASFSYGNYDGKNQTPSFDLYLGVNLWSPITINYGTGAYHFAEIIHIPPSDSDTIQVCLVKTGPTIPCTSTLELRPLNSSIYPIITSSTTPAPLLIIGARFDVASLKWPSFSR